MPTRLRIASKLSALILSGALTASAFAQSVNTPRDLKSPVDVIIVGAGLAGLSAALEAGRAGAKVLVIDQASIFGGHAVMSAGDVAIVDTPLQRANDIHDSPALAYEDFTRWGIDADVPWVRYYVDHSKNEIYDWLTDLGVKFKGVGQYPGNSVPRAHNTAGRGLGLVRPVYLETLRNANISFKWNTEVLRLKFTQGAVRGVEGKNLRTGRLEEFPSRAVVIATGGFESNISLALVHWPSDLPKPPILLAGSGVNSLGSGLKLATDVGGTLSKLDHQWNYERGLPDPRYPGMNRGLNALVDGIRVNTQGSELTTQDAASDELLRDVLNQPGATYWAIFDENQKRTFWISGSDWGNFETIQRLILDNPAIVKKASSIEELALQTGIPRESLERSISKHNEHESRIETAPYYAAQFYPMTRKSMGGIAINLGARVLDRQSHAIPGLYAAGEAVGEAGINGKRAFGRHIFRTRGHHRANRRPLGNEGFFNIETTLAPRFRNSPSCSSPPDRRFVFKLSFTRHACQNTAKWLLALRASP